MTADHAPIPTVRTPVSVRPGAAVTVGFLTILLGAFTLPAAVPDRPSVAYLSAGLAGAALLLGLLLAADLARAAVARRAGVQVDGITVGAFGSRLRATTTGINEPSTGARIACAGLAVSGLGGAGLVTLGWLAPGGSLALAGSVGLWVGGLALLITLSELLPAPRTGGGRLLAALVYRRTGSRERADAAAARAGVITGWILIASGAALIFLAGAMGLWVALLGWLALGSGRVEQSRLRTNRALAGVCVGDVMGSAPEIVPGWRTVSAVVEAMADQGVPVSGQAVFAVVDFDGGLAGVAHLRDLAAVPLDDRGLTRMVKVSVPMAAVPTTTPNELLSDLLPRLAERPAAGCALVLDGDVLDGDVLDGDVGRDGLSNVAAAVGRPRLIGTVGYSEIARALATVALVPTGTVPARDCRPRNGRP
ncbi:peptidase M50 [Frankia sp. Cr2]|uniref:peptidase M50 n=1 Tax=Frankia sp. Cr2 TaxID=3073932 RepID=UPI002AD2C0A7|nr:peptidase M50 [Frankia sp. Cr2]